MLFFVRVFTGFSVATSVVALSQQSTKTAAAIIQADGINRIHDVLSADVLNNPDVANELQFYRVVTGSMSKHDSASVVVTGPPLLGIMPFVRLYVMPSSQPAVKPSTRVVKAPKTWRDA